MGSFHKGKAAPDLMMPYYLSDVLNSRLEKEEETKTVGREHRVLVGLAPALSSKKGEDTTGHLVGLQGELWDRKKIFHWAGVPKIYFFNNKINYKGDVAQGISPPERRGRLRVCQFH